MLNKHLSSENEMKLIFSKALTSSASQIIVSDLHLNSGEAVSFVLVFLNGSTNRDITLKAEANSGASTAYHTYGAAITGSGNVVRDEHFNQSQWYIGYASEGRFTSTGTVIAIDGDAQMSCKGVTAASSSPSSAYRDFAGACNVAGDAGIDKLIFGTTNGSFPAGTKLLVYRAKRGGIES